MQESTRSKQLSSDLRVLDEVPASVNSIIDVSAEKLDLLRQIAAKYEMREELMMAFCDCNADVRVPCSHQRWCDSDPVYRHPKYPLAEEAHLAYQEARAEEKAQLQLELDRTSRIAVASQDEQ